jgi:hypothetical protein
MLETEVLGVWVRDGEDCLRGWFPLVIETGRRTGDKSRIVFPNAVTNFLQNK